jgi:hypothetical protein
MQDYAVSRLPGASQEYASVQTNIQHRPYNIVALNLGISKNLRFWWDDSDFDGANTG